MTDVTERAIELPAIFPIFPLTGALLLPNGRLPLNIFEPRYLAMIEDSLAAGRMFGMIQPDAKKPETEAGPGLYRIGCLGRISAFSETDDGRFLITLTGLIRFEMIEELPIKRGYRRIRAEFRSFIHDVEPPPEPGPEFDRDALMTALRHYFTHIDIDANWSTIEAMNDDELIITLAMACPFSPAEKQAVLEAEDARARAKTLLALLEINAHMPHN